MTKAKGHSVYDQALLDYYTQSKRSPLILNNDYGDPEEMPVEVFFREEEDLTELEQYALQLVNGNILDVGAGVGVHTLILQNLRHDVTAIERTQAACDIMKKRGVSRVINADIYEHSGNEKYDTILLLMNGAGLAGKLDNFPIFLERIKTFLKPSGQIIMDSSDITYLYEDELPIDKYYGEINYQYTYKQQQGEWFPWLYIDQEMLIRQASLTGFDAQIVYEDDYDQYLAILRLHS